MRMCTKIALTHFKFPLLLRIKACANASGDKDRKRQALQIAVSAFRSLETIGLTAGSITYTSIIHAIDNLMDDSTEMNKALGDLFRQVCSDGQLNQHMLKLLADNESMSMVQMTEMTGVTPSYEGTIQIDDLPLEWSQNATDKLDV